MKEEADTQEVSWVGSGLAAQVALYHEVALWLCLALEPLQDQPQDEPSSLVLPAACRASWPCP